MLATVAKRWLEGLGLLVSRFSLLLQDNLLSLDRDLFWCIDADADLTVLVGDHLDADIVADHDRLTGHA